MRSALGAQKMARTTDFRMLVVLAAAALAAGLLVIVAAEKPAKAAFPGTNGLIVFTSDRDSTEGSINDRIYAMNSGGTKTISLTTTTYPTIDQWPALSPNGLKIAFQRGQDGPTFFSGSEIYRMDVEDNTGPSGVPDGNGDNLTRLTNNTRLDAKPAWSVDGSKIAFYSNRPSPLGCTIGSSGCTVDLEVYVMDAKDKDGDGNGDHLSQLTNNPAGQQDVLPAFSPDGTMIAFASNRPSPLGCTVGTPGCTTDFDIWVMKAEPESDTNVPINLTDNSGINDGWTITGNQGFWSQISWSPDGKKIAFQSWESVGTTVDASVDIYAMDLTFDEVTGAITGATPPDNLTGTGPLNYRYPAWSPDGSSIAFWSAVGSGLGSNGNTSEIYSMDTSPLTDLTDDVNTHNLTNNNVGDIQPDWGPITKQQCDKDLVAGGAPQRYPIYEVLDFASEDECRIASGG